MKYLFGYGYALCVIAGIALTWAFLVWPYIVFGSILGTVAWLPIGLYSCIITFGWLEDRR